MSGRGRDVALVLGSGGARGLAHIGVIHELESRGYRIRAISGSSIGALVGGVHAVGALDAYERWVCGLDQSDVLGLVDWTLTGGGLIRGETLMRKLGELLGDRNIEDLPVDYTAVAVDIERGREVWFTSGPLLEAIRASIAIPGVFVPHEYGGRTLVDGGLLNPIPVAPTLRTQTDLTIVVDANDEPLEAHPLDAERNRLDRRLGIDGRDGHHEYALRHERDGRDTLDTQHTHGKHDMRGEHGKHDMRGEHGEYDMRGEHGEQGTHQALETRDQPDQRDDRAVGGMDPPVRSGDSGWWERVRAYLRAFTGNHRPVEAEMAVSELLLRSLETMQTTLTRHHLAVFHPDLTIGIPRNACRVHEFHRARELIDLGRNRARAALDARASQGGGTRRAGLGDPPWPTP